MDAEQVVNMISYAGDSPVFKSPSDYDPFYEDVTFTANGVVLAGWFIYRGRP